MAVSFPSYSLNGVGWENKGRAAWRSLIVIWLNESTGYGHDLTFLNQDAWMARGKIMQSFFCRFEKVLWTLVIPSQISSSGSHGPQSKWGRAGGPTQYDVQVLSDSFCDCDLNFFALSKHKLKWWGKMSVSQDFLPRCCCQTRVLWRLLGFHYKVEPLQTLTHASRVVHLSHF